jgi:hypothetical protein
MTDPDRAPLPDEGETWRCLKCGFRQVETEPCHRCGLDPTLLDGEHPELPWESVPEDRAPFVEELEKRWAALLDDFMEPEKHRDIIAYATVTALVDLLARRYRLFAQDEPDDAKRTRAQQSMGRLVEVMQAQFASGRGEDEGELWERRTKVIKRVVYVVVVLACVGVVALAFAVVRPWH